jgi:chromosome segregation ATPase
MAQIEVDLSASRLDGERERTAAEAARTELAKSLLRLEAMPRLEADLASLRLELDKERQGRVMAEQQAAVLGAKLEAAIERSAKAESAALDALAQARSSGEAVFAEATKVEAAKNTIANLSGKLEAMQAQIERQALDLDAARQGVKNVSDAVAGTGGKVARNAAPKAAKE